MGFVNVLYFSVMTITTLGYSSIEPTSPWTQNLASLEGLLAFVWTAIVFALLLLHLESQHFGGHDGRRPPREESIALPQRVTTLIEELEAELVLLEQKRPV